MTKKETVSSRLEPELVKKLDELADEQGVSRASYTRSILKERLRTEELEGTDIRQDFRSDIEDIGSHGDGQPLIDALESVWEEIASDSACSDAWEAVANTDHISVVGQGSSYAVGVWLAARFREDGLSAHACHAGELSETGGAADEMVVAISRSGETGVMLDAIDTLSGPQIVGLTHPESSLADAAGHVIPLPAVNESVGAYATLSVIGSVATAQIALFDDNPTLENVRKRMNTLSRFAKQHFGGDDVIAGLRQNSDFIQLVNELEANDDTAGAPVVPVRGWHRGVGAELQQKTAELLYAHGEAVDLFSVRDRVLNSVIRGDNYLLTFLPDVGTAAYDIYNKILFENPESIDAVLTQAPETGGTPIVCCTFNPHGPIEEQVRNRSAYGDAAVIGLSAGAPDRFAKELLAFYAAYLFVHATLHRRWTQDEILQTQLLQDVYNKNIITDAQ